MKLETDWKLIFVQVLDTLLFELKLLRPAFVLLLALLPTSTVFFFIKNMIALPNRTAEFPWVYSY